MNISGTFFKLWVQHLQLEKYREANKSKHCDPNSSTFIQEHCFFFGHCSFYIINLLELEFGI
jgi:hypothetical protein